MNVDVLPPRWLWPAIILCSAVASGLLFFLELASSFRLLTTLWFLLVCPGMAFVRLFQFDETYYEWTLAIALSISLDAIVACILLYTGAWSIELGLWIMILTSLLGAILQIFALPPQPVASEAGQYLNAQWHRAERLKCPVCWSEKKQWKAGFSRSGRQRYQCSQCKKIYTPTVDTPTNETSTHVIPQTLKVNRQKRANWIEQYTAKLPITLSRISHK